MDRNIPQIHDLVQEVSWHFRNREFCGEYYKDISLVEYMTLKKVNDIQNITMQEIGISLNKTKSGITKIIDRLEKKTYVFRVQSSVDGRICCVLLTGKGKKALHDISHRHYEYLQDILGVIDEESLQNIKYTLELLSKAIQGSDKNKNLNNNKASRKDKNICCSY